MANENVNINAKIVVETSGEQNVNKVNEALKNTAKTTKEATDGVNNSSQSFSKLKETLGNVVPGFKAADEATSAFNSKLLQLLKNPIVLLIAAIVAALYALKNAFTSSDEGAAKFEEILSAVGAVLQELKERALAVANAIVKIFQGDFKGAFEEGKKAVTGFGDAMESAFKRGGEAARMLDDVQDATRVLAIQFAAMQDKFNQAREILGDTEATYQQKKKALKDSQEEIDKYFKSNEEIANKNLDAIAKKYNVEKAIIEARKKGFSEGAKDLDDFLQTLAIGEKGIEDIENSIKKVLEASAQRAAKQRAQNKLEKAVDKEQDAKDREALRNRLEEEKKYQSLKFEFEAKARLANLKDEFDKMAESARQQAQQKEKEIQNLKISNSKKVELEKLLNKELLAQLDEIHNKRITKEKELQNKLDEERKKAEQKILDEAAKQMQAEQDAEDARTLNLIKRRNAQTKLSQDIENANKSKYKKELDDLEKFYKESMALAEGNEELQIQLKDDYAKKKKKIEDDNNNAILNSVKTVGDNIIEIVGRQTAEGKAIASAQALINTYQGVTEALSQKSVLPSPFDVVAKVINVAAVLASGFKAIEAINRVVVPTQGAGGAGVSGASIAAPIAPTQSTTALNSQSIQAIGNAAGGGTVKAFVLESDIKNNADRVSRINRAARLG